MIFVLHYILFSSGLSFVVILTALFLQTYSDASMSEIGSLLMALPFLSILARPFFCALADRHQAHKLYLIGACFCMALGYGSMAIAPFFPDFIKQHGRLVWYLDVIGIIIGYSSFSVVFSLGDALALNAARKRGISWSLYRVWSTLSWGVFGYLIGLFNETPALPKYVPGIFVLVGAMGLEMILLAIWKKEAFDMNDHAASANNEIEVSSDNMATSMETHDKATKDDGFVSMQNTPFGTINGTASARLVGALAGMVVEDIGSTLKSSLRLNKQDKQKRIGLSEMLEQHSNTDLVSSPKRMAISACPSLNLSHQMPQADIQEPSNKPSLRRHLDAAFNESTSSSSKIFTANMSRSLGPANGHKLGLQNRDSEKSPANHGAIVFKKLTNINEQANKFENSPESGLATMIEQPSSFNTRIDDIEESCQMKRSIGANELTDNANYPEDLQMLLLKFIVKRDRTIMKILVSFTFFGFLMSVHASYFFVHLEEVCRQEGYEFSRVMGALCLAQSASEIFSFIFMVRYYMPFVGRMGSLLSCAILIGVRFAYYGTYFSVLSPYIALTTEVCYGLAYGMIYTLVCDCACDCVEQVGQYLPELQSRGLIDPSINANQLKLPLRATMQGVFSGAFDGLGYGLGALFGGLYLDVTKDYIGLWQIGAGISGLTLVFILMSYNRASAPPASKELNK